MADNIRIEHVRPHQIFTQRNPMLAKCLRDHTLPWDYGAEYPLILGPEACEMSWCLYDGDHMAAHASLWFRILRHVANDQTHRIALVGNVATAADYRGQGHMRRLIAHVVETAEREGANAIVLWSDLSEFYQKLGFSSIGRERRFVFHRKDQLIDSGVRRVDAHSLSDSDLQMLLDRRPKVEWTLVRTVAEFRGLLSIPECHLFLRRQRSQIASWCLIGKGSDMNGVIHEWGASCADELAADAQTIIHQYELSELTLLAPMSLHHHWLQPLGMRSASYQDHAMALAKPLGPNGKEATNALARGFIWGLDSI